MKNGVLGEEYISLFTRSVRTGFNGGRKEAAFLAILGNFCLREAFFLDSRSLTFFPFFFDATSMLFLGVFLPILFVSSMFFEKMK